MANCKTWGIKEFNEWIRRGWIRRGCNLNNTVTVLDLYNCGLTSLPESIGNLRAVTWLCVTCNKLTSLPESIGNLADLRYLYVYNNQLTSLPESIGCLNSLEELRVYGNQLASLPESITNLKYIKKVHVDFYLKDIITNVDMLKFVLFKEEKGDTKPAM